MVQMIKHYNDQSKAMLANKNHMKNDNFTSLLPNKKGNIAKNGQINQEKDEQNRYKAYRKG